MRKVIIPIIGFVFLITILLGACSDQLDPVSVNENSDILNSSVPAANQVTHASSDVHWLDDGSEVEGAEATLLRTRNNVRMTIKTTDLEPHHTYTIWWVIFNNPEECESDCDMMVDLFNDEVGGSLLYAAGNVIGGNGKGNFAGSLRVGDISGCQAPWDVFNFCREGLVDVQNAEIQLVVRTHGERIPGMVNDQINTYAGGCTADSSFGGSDGPNVCEDQQIAVFETD